MVIKFIRFLSKISGVEKNIKDEERKRIGRELNADSRWFCGLYYGDIIPEFKSIEFVLKQYDKQLKKGYTINVSSLREDVFWFMKKESLLK